MLTRTLAIFLVATFLVESKHLLCKKLRSGSKMRVDLTRDSNTIIFFPTYGVKPSGIRPGAKNIDKLLYDPVNIFSENENIIMKIHLTVNYAPAIGDEGTLDLFFELPFGGCQDDSTDNCSENIPDSTFPWIRFCAPVPFTASDRLPVSLELSVEGNFLVVKNGGKFLGKAAIPNKNCDSEQSREFIYGIGAAVGDFRKFQPQLCQEWNF
ncbi:hypothetical protein ACHWQZ_G018742 [Mnemiopsis leidyi]